MRILDAFIVYHRNAPIAVFINKESAYSFIEAQGNINPAEWNIYQSKLHMPELDRAIAGQVNVTIPRHVLE